MTGKSDKVLRCAIYTRKSTEHGLELEFNSLDAQREACEAYVKSQASEGWRVLPARYDDPAYSGANLDRPALQRLLKDLQAGAIDIVVGLQDRPADPLAHRFCEVGRDLRGEGGFLRRYHPAIQH